jgi:hypothetical protein
MVWAAGLLVAVLCIAQLVQVVVDSARDIVSPYRVVADLPEPGPEAWTIRGAARLGVWSHSLVPGARIIVDRDRIGVRQATIVSDPRCYLVERSDVTTVVVVTGPFGAAGIGVRGAEQASKLVVFGTNRRAAETELDRLGWPHERRRGRLLRPFA